MITVIGQNRPLDGAIGPQTAIMDGGTSRTPVLGGYSLRLADYEQ